MRTSFGVRAAPNLSLWRLGSPSWTVDISSLLFFMLLARVPLLPMPVFTPHQDAALSAASNWLKGARGRSSIFRLFGYAGTGKTTLVKHIAEGVDGKVLFAAFTGKAACVMRSKGCYSASTIHSLIYKARESGEETPSFELWNDAPASKAKLIIIDECVDG